MNILDHSKKHQQYFEELCNIPHGSFYEQAYSDYVVTFAKAHQFRYKQDAMGNVLVFKDGTSGYEDHPRVLLQAHMDMVCEKNEDVDFDFQSQGLDLYIEDGWLKAHGTTLGADDGTGVAYMLAILDDTSIAHPPLECIFTVQEEVGLFGALAIQKEDIEGKRLINLDDGGETSTCTTSAGGVNVIMERDLCMEKTSTPAYQIKVMGLRGGHSGGEIDKEHGNANKILARTLYAMSRSIPINLVHIHGGLMDNAIPREAAATITCDASFSVIQEIVSNQLQLQKKELEFSDVGLQIECKQTTCKEQLSFEDSKAVLELLRLLPNGLRHHSMSIEGLSTASNNVGVITMKEGHLFINISVRGALESFIDDIAEEIELLASAYGFSSKQEARYPAWSYDASSFMRDQLQAVFLAQYQTPLTLVAVHGGLECGVFKALDADLDIVTMGPIMHDIHTPAERLDIASFDRTFELLVQYLQVL